MRIEAGHNSCPGRGAYRLGDVSVLEYKTLISKCIQIRDIHVVSAVATHSVVSLLVAKQEYDVRSSLAHYNSLQSASDLTGHILKGNKLLAAPQSRIHYVSHCVPQQIESEHCNSDKDSGQYGEVRSKGEPTLGSVQHVTPGRCRWSYSEA